jgi:hypothetical protein
VAGNRFIRAYLRRLSSHTPERHVSHLQVVPSFAVHGFNADRVGVGLSVHQARLRNNGARTYL